MSSRAFVLVVAVLALAGSTSVTHAQTVGLPQGEIDAIVLKFQAAYADTFDRRARRGSRDEPAELLVRGGTSHQGRDPAQAHAEAALIRVGHQIPTRTASGRCGGASFTTVVVGAAVADIGREGIEIRGRHGH